ncbi:nucleoporin NUP42, partial [Lecanoromycetidae sp. Uapishka_2]
MTVCPFFLQGKCKFGGSSSIRDAPYKLDKTIITTDLSKERPQWILSTYGPGRDAPIQLFGGHPREQSFEELRIRHYELAAQNNQQLAIQEAQNLVSNAEQQVQTALNDVDGAIRYIINGENEHPNRIDVCKAKGAIATQPPSSNRIQQSAPAFGQPSNTTQAFGLTSTPSTIGQPSSSKPAFGQPSAPSAFGRSSAPAFGQPSAPVSTFGQPSTSAFGQSSAFGQPASLGRPMPSFGQPASGLGQNSSTFGKPSVSALSFGQPSGPTSFGVGSQKPSPFGATPTTIAISQPSSTPSQPNYIVGQPSAPGQPGSFGKPSAPTASTQPNPFGPPSASTQPGIFGKPSVTNTTGAFGQPQTSRPPAGPSQSSTASPNPFGKPNAPQTTSAFGQPSRPGPNQPPTASTAREAAPQPARTQPSNTAQVQKDAQGKVRSWNGKPVTYLDNEPCYKGIDGNWQKIWFPDGPPIFTKSIDLPDDVYDEATKENYAYVKEHGTFKDGMMPDLPPKREWCTWNF